MIKNLLRFFIFGRIWLEFCEITRDYNRFFMYRYISIFTGTKIGLRQEFLKLSTRQWYFTIKCLYWVISILYIYETVFIIYKILVAIISFLVLNKLLKDQLFFGNYYVLHLSTVFYFSIQK